MYVLGDDTVPKFLEANKQALVVLEFYAPWCGHCKNLAPEYAKAASELASETDPPIKLAKVDATVHAKIAQEYGVSGYPTLYIVSEGAKKPYEGPREADGIVTYLKKKAGPAVRTVDAAKIAALKEDSSTVYYVLVEGADAGAARTAFETVAKGDDSKEFFAVPLEGNPLGATATSVVAVMPDLYASKFETDATSTELTAEAIEAFVKAKAVPLVGELNGQTYRAYFQAPVPMVRTVAKAIDFKEGAEAANAIADVAREIAPEFAGKFVFSVEYPIDFVVDDFGVKESMDMEKPLVVIDGRYAKGGDGKKYLQMPQEEFTADNLKAYLNKYLGGELKPHLKSEPVPAEPAKPGEVAVVVGANFDKVVMDESKDVLLEVYAPWCGHCKKLAPIYDELAKEYTEEKDLVIAKFDGTANDLPHPKINVRGFPSIFFLPAGGKAEPVKYDGGRELKDFTAYLQKHSTKLPKAAEDASAGEAAPAGEAKSEL